MRQVLMKRKRGERSEDERTPQTGDMACFRADPFCCSPESYSLEEKREVCNDMMGGSKAVLDPMREGLERLPAEARSKLPDMLCASGVESPSGGGTCWRAKTIRSTVSWSR